MELKGGLYGSVAERAGDAPGLGRVSALKASITQIIDYVLADLIEMITIDFVTLSVYNTSVNNSEMARGFRQASLSARRG